MVTFDDIFEIIGKYYNVLTTIFYLIYSLLFIGVIYLNHEYLYLFRMIMQILVCLFLIYRFHPFQQHVLKSYDSRIIFSSAIFLLINIGIVEIASNIFSPITREINHVFLNEIVK